LAFTQEYQRGARYRNIGLRYQNRTAHPVEKPFEISARFCLPRCDCAQHGRLALRNLWCLGEVPRKQWIVDEVGIGFLQSTDDLVFDKSPFSCLPPICGFQFGAA
jgi:hypothetical protein